MNTKSVSLPEFKGRTVTRPLTERLINLVIYKGETGQRKAVARDYAIAWFCLCAGIWLLALVAA